jgi:ubiquitin-conjugating enzyme E2 J2
MKLIKKDPHKYIDVAADEKDLLIWYFLIKGPEFSDYKGGYYIGKIMHNPEYPLKPPDFMMLTPSGRFMIGSKICLSNSSYHSNEWSAMWNIHTILTGFLSIMLDDKEHGISHIHATKAEKDKFAKESIEYNKKNHPDIMKLFNRFLDPNGNILPDEPVKSKPEPVKEEPKPEPKTEPVKEEPKPEPKPEPVKEEPKPEPKPEPVKEEPKPEPVKEEVSTSNRVKTKRVNKQKQQEKIFDPLTLEVKDFSSTMTEYKKLVDNQ